MATPKTLARTCFSLFTILTILITGCGKDHDSAPQPPPREDTLSAGWSKISLGKLADLFFINEKVGYVGGKKLFKTLDGGLTWKTSSLPDSGAGIQNMFFIDENYGWIAGYLDNENVIYRTTDGGLTFQKTFTQGTAYLSDLQFLNKRQGYLIADNKFFKSIDSGKTWISSATLPSPASTLHFADAEKGTVVTRSYVFQTKDAGNSFTQTHAFPGPTSALGMYFLDAYHGWIPNNQGYLSTKDDGATWNQVNVPGNSFDVHFFNDEQGYLLQRESILKTVDGGKSFTRVVKAYSLLELQFIDERHGWAISEGGNLYRFNQP